MKKFTYKIRALLSAIYWQYRNLDAGWPGKLAKKYGMVVGHIGCPHCGIGVSGIIENSICKWCERDFWEGEDNG